MNKALLLIALVMLVGAQSLFAYPTKMLQRRVRIASDVVRDRMLSAHPIPHYVLDASQCLASIKVVKAGFIWGGEGSTGLVSCKVNGEWSAPSFLNTGGVNFGFQIGVQFLESVLVFMTQQGRELLNGPQMQLGVDIGFAAGPVGGGAGTGFIPKAHVLTYNRAVGLYAGATVQGMVLSHGIERNSAVYGYPISGREILMAPGHQAPALVQPFIETLRQFAPIH